MKISSRTGIIITALCCLCMLSYFSLSRKRNKIVEVNDGPNILETMAGRNDSSPFDLVSPLASTSQMFPKVPLHHNIAQIRVRSGSLVDHIEFVMADGNVKTGGYVPPGGNRAPPFGLDPVFVLDPEEHVIRIEMSQGEMLSAIKIFTSKGKETQWYGTKIQKGRLKVFAASAENPIVSFERDSGRVCPRITKVQLLDGTIQEPTNQARPKIARKGGEVRARSANFTSHMRHGTEGSARCVSNPAPRSIPCPPVIAPQPPHPIAPIPPIATAPI